MLLDVDAAVAKRRPFLVGLGDLGLEGDDALESVVDLGHALTPSRGPRCGHPHAFCPIARRPRLGHDRARTWPRCVRSTPAAGWPSPTSPPTRSRCSGAGSPRRRRPGCTSRTRWWSRRRTPAAGRRRGWCCSRALDERGFVFFTNTRSRKGEELAGQPALLAALPVAPAGAAGPRRRDGRAAAADRRGGVLRHAAARLPARRLGLATSRGWSSGREELTTRTRAPKRGTPTTCRCPTSGAGTSWPPEAVEFWQGRPGPDARPAGLPPRCGPADTRGLGGRPSRPVTTPG